MSYKALYRKYRPSTFEEVVGQQSIVATLLNAVKTNKLAHAYLFCGPRGTGKTTVAKLLAKTINCQSEDENKPCGHCHSCIDIQESTHPDVIELDAATNNGVDEVREIIEKVKYAPLNGKYKVYIIDEVHMMTASAFNALLKTLEEPPEYCIFILATTEPHKVLPTIISRCQRFDFRKIDNRTIEARLKDICFKENISCQEEAFKLIAELADGGMRDALSILDQCIAYVQDNITVEDVSSVYGVASLSEKLQLFEYVKNRESRKLVEKVGDISARGLDVQRLTIDLINIAKECVVYAYSQDPVVLNTLSRQQAEEMLQKFSSTQLLKYIDYLIETQGRYREASNALTYFEVCLLKMMDYQPENNRIAPVSPVQQPKKEETVQVVEPVQEKPVSESEEVKIPEYANYGDEEIYNILCKANKEYKTEDFEVLKSLDYQKMGLQNAFIEDALQKANIMASSAENIILIVDSRQQANQINNLDNKKMLEDKLAGCLKNRKDIFAVTTDQCQFLINYFRARKSSELEKPAVKEEKTEEVDKTSRLAELFGKDGFDEVE